MSEELCGQFIKESSGNGGVIPPIATKFAALPWRFTADTVKDALKDSLKRLDLGRVDLYMQHWPGILFNDNYLDGLAQCKTEGLCRAVGVSNFSKSRIENAVRRLSTRGIPLASNQVQYSLLYRNPERNGMLQACRENGVTLVAYR